MSSEQQLPDLKDENSIYNFVCQKISSKSFRDPIKYFIDENCSSFIGVNENTFEQGELFNEFTQFIDNLLDDVLNEGHLSKEMFLLAAKKGLNDQKYKKHFEQLIAFSNYNYFKSMMTKRNFAIIKMVEEEIAKREKDEKLLQTKEQEKELNDKEMEQAIKMSLALEEEIRRIQEIEDEELRRAIAASLEDVNKSNCNKNNDSINISSYNNNTITSSTKPKNELQSTSLSIKGTEKTSENSINSNIDSIPIKKDLPKIFGEPRNFDKVQFEKLEYQRGGHVQSNVQVEKIDQKEQERKVDELEKLKQDKLREYREMILKMERDNAESKAKETLSKEEMNKLEGRKKLADILKKNRSKITG